MHKQKPANYSRFLICTGGRNRTHAKGFGDPRTTIILRPPTPRRPELRRGKARQEATATEQDRKAKSRSSKPSTL